MVIASASSMLFAGACDDHAGETSVAMEAAPTASGGDVRDRIESTLRRIPLSFVENRGQSDPEVAYYVQGRDKSLYFTSEGVTFALNDPTRRWNVKRDFVGANAGVVPVGQDRMPGVISYFKGPREQWKTGIPTYSTLVYPDLWPGIDLVYTGAVGQVKYRFLVKPGADPGRIQLAYRGAGAVRLDDQGRIEVSTPVGGFTDAAPYAYQERGGERVEVKSAYALEAGGAGTTSRQGFHLEAYDRSLPLVIDPAVIVYAGYVGGSQFEQGFGIAVDAEGNAYITGVTRSSEATFPVVVGPDLTFNESFNLDAFVTKIDRTGTAFVYSGYVGGEGDDSGAGIAVDRAGNAYITGRTTSSDGTFPVKKGPDLTYNDGDSDAFVTKIDRSGTELVYSGFIGGVGADEGVGIAVDEDDNAYVSGDTDSSEATFPVRKGPDLTYNGGLDGFIARINASGKQIIYCGYIGGAGDDSAGGVAVDENGNAYLSGTTDSDQSTFPVKVGPDLTFNGARDAFVAKVTPSGHGLVYAGYVGGSDDDSGNGIAVDATGNAYLVGQTASDQTSFPVKIGPDTTFNGSRDAFVAKVTRTGQGLVYAGYIGGLGVDGGNGVAVDSTGNAYVVGTTLTSPAVNGTFPVLNGPDSTPNGLFDAFVSKVDASGAALLYSGFVGGSGADFGAGIAVDCQHSAYLVGTSSSSASTFPVKGGPDLTNAGLGDAFVAKISMTSAP